jgi:AcrR family transcriptional regulator
MTEAVLSGRTSQILATALRLLEAVGPEALTMRRLATEVGMQAPSLYRHFESKDALLSALQAHALADQAVATAGVEDLAGLASAYRGWALAHPRLYELVARHPLDRHLLPPGSEQAAQAALLRLTDGDVARARALWGVAHGLVDLELTGRFPPGADIAAAWRAAVAAFVQPVR